MLLFIHVSLEPMLWMLFTIVFAPIVGFLLICILFILCCLCCIKCARKKNRYDRHTNHTLTIIYSHQFSDYPYEIPFEEGESEEESLDKYKKLETPISIWMSKFVILYLYETLSACNRFALG